MCHTRLNGLLRPVSIWRSTYLYLIYGTQSQPCENNCAYENGHMLILDIALIWIITFVACFKTAAFKLEPIFNDRTLYIRTQKIWPMVSFFKLEPLHMFTYPQKPCQLQLVTFYLPPPHYKICALYCAYNYEFSAEEKHRKISTWSKEHKQLLIMKIHSLNK